VKSAFLGNNSTINRVPHSTQLVAYKHSPPHQGEIKFGNNATIDHVSQRTQQLSYDSTPTNQAESALFFRNESKIDHASIDNHYIEIVWLDGVPYRQAVSKFIGSARRGPSTFGGNDSMMMRHPEQLLYDDVTSRQGQSAFVGNDSTSSWHQEQLFLYDDIPSH
jgi:hypothetical protein